MLVDSEWEKYGDKLILEGFNPKNVQPNSYDVTLSDDILVYRRAFFRRKLQLSGSNQSDFKHAKSEGYLLRPGECVLGSTNEIVYATENLNGQSVVMQLCGRSSHARKFLSIHVTAGFIDTGFLGKLTLELVNHSPRPITLEKGVRIGQLIAFMVPRVSRPYGSKGLGSHYTCQLQPLPSGKDS